MSRMHMDADGTMSFDLLLDWFAYDVDGTIASKVLIMIKKDGI